MGSNHSSTDRMGKELGFKYLSLSCAVAHFATAQNSEIVKKQKNTPVIGATNQITRGGGMILSAGFSDDSTGPSSSGWLSWVGSVPVSEA